ncbi:MAG: hypothetical protein FWG89_04090 [Treponema sp.]|nr:hypothetical protein [Treponema sp.]
MKRAKFSLLPGLSPALVVMVTQLFFACAGQENSLTAAESNPGFWGIPASTVNNVFTGGTADFQDAERIIDLLDQIAELERSGVYQRGMALTESGLRERLGDYSGAALAAYKEMSWAYGYGELDKERITQGLLKIIELEGQPGTELTVQTAKAILAFEQGKWDDAEQRLDALVDYIDEQDSFVNWMRLTCALEKNHADRNTASAYRVIRARYTQYPEYWYRGARAFSGIIASQYAELCINLAPQGPFAAECRNILASFFGLKPEDSQKIKTKLEIDDLVTHAVNMGNPALLEPLMSLVGLQENPFTEYAFGALKSLAASPAFRDYFDGLAVRSGGRLAERLAYISRR